MDYDLCSIPETYVLCNTTYTGQSGLLPDGLERFSEEKIQKLYVNVNPGQIECEFISRAIDGTSFSELK